MTCAICVILNLIPFVICTKSGIGTWIKTFKIFGIKEYIISNYEQMRNCKVYTDENTKESIECQYIKKTIICEDNKKDVVNYEWVNLPKNMIFIFDEAHKCKNKKSQNSKLLSSLAKIDYAYILLLSATLFDLPNFFPIFADVFKIQYTKTKMNTMLQINKILYPEYAARLNKYELNDFMKENIVVKYYEMKDVTNRHDIYNEYNIFAKIDKLNEQKKIPRKNAFGNLDRQISELTKIPIVINSVKQYLENNMSVAIFANYTETLNILAEHFNTTHIINGEQSNEDKIKYASDFCNDLSLIVICNIKSGGTSISLHDQIGKRKKVSIILPSYSAQDLKQGLGRIHRANGKTDVLQEIIFCDLETDTKVSNIVEVKMNNIEQLNNGYSWEKYKIDFDNTKNNNYTFLDISQENNIERNKDYAFLDISQEDSMERNKDYVFLDISQDD